MTVSMVLFSIGEEDWLAPYYDKATGRILSGDSPIVQNSKDYDRFVLLDEDEAEYRPLPRISSVLIRKNNSG